MRPAHAPTTRRDVRKHNPDATQRASRGRGRRVRTSKRRDEDARGDLDAERDDGERALDEHREEDRADDGRGLRRGVEHAQARVRVLAAVTTLCEEVVDELGPAHASVGVQEAEDRGNESDLLSRSVRVNVGRRADNY